MNLEEITLEKLVEILSEDLLKKLAKKYTKKYKMYNINCVLVNDRKFEIHLCGSKKEIIKMISDVVKSICIDKTQPFKGYKITFRTLESEVMYLICQKNSVVKINEKRENFTRVCIALSSGYLRLGNKDVIIENFVRKNIIFEKFEIKENYKNDFLICPPDKKENVEIVSLYSIYPVFTESFQY